MFVALVLVGCGGSSSSYAGLTPEAAKTKADAVMARRVSAPGFHFKQLERVKDPLTRPAWRATYERARKKPAPPPAYPGAPVTPTLPGLGDQVTDCVVYVAKAYDYFAGC